MKMMIEMPTKGRDYLVENFTGLKLILEGNIQDGINKILKNSFVNVQEEITLSLENSDKIKSFFFRNSNDVFCKNREKEIIKFIDILSNLSENRDSFEIDLSASEERSLAFYLDLLTRISLGQWEHLAELHGINFVYTDYQKYIDEIDEIVRETFKGNFFGIYSRNLSEKCHFTYDFFKEFMYERGVGGVYSYEPLPSSKLPISISFEYTEVYTPRNEIEIKNFLDKGRKYLKEDGLYYVPTRENCYFLVSAGETICRKRNGFYDIKKTKN